MDVTPSTQQLQFQNQPNSVGTTPLTSPGSRLAHTLGSSERYGGFAFLALREREREREFYNAQRFRYQDSFRQNQHDATSVMTETHAQTNRRFWVNNIMPLQAQINEKKSLQHMNESDR